LGLVIDNGFISYKMNIDYNKIINRNQIDFAKYNAKFEKADKWLRSEKRDPEEYGKMLSDPTIFAYFHFRVDGASAKLYPYQDMIINDPYRYKYFRAANQIGKSLCLDFQAARNLLWDHGKNHNEAIVSKSLPQSVFQMRRVRSLLNTMPELEWDEAKGTADSSTLISVDIKDHNKPLGRKIKYSNLLITAPCTEGLLGYDLHDLNLDEFEFWETDTKYFFNQIAQPRTYTTKGNITVFSNPNGQDSYGAELEQQLMRNLNKKWHVYVFNYLDKPGNTQEEFDELKNELPRVTFESTVGALRTISDRNYFSYEELKGSEDKSLNIKSMLGKQPYYFMDVGAKNDQSVLIGGYAEPDPDDERFLHIYAPTIKCYPIGYPLARVVGSEAIEDDGWHYEKSVREHLLEIKQMTGMDPIFGVDVTGNTGIVPLFEACNVFPHDVKMDGPTKSGMYQRFKYFMEKGLFHRIPCKEFDYQGAHMIMKKSARHYLMIHHEREEDLDDVMDACAGLIFLIDPVDVKTGPVGFKMI